METRTAAEVLAYRGKDGNPCPFGFDREALVLFLTFEEARPWLGPDAKLADWHEAAPRTRDAALAEILGYMDFAIEKAVSHRGISAWRSVAKMRAWCWLTGDAEALAICDERPYEQYGAPILKALCDHFRIPWEAKLSSLGDRAIFEAQARGERCPSCEAGTDSGCGDCH